MPDHDYQSVFNAELTSPKTQWFGNQGGGGIPSRLRGSGNQMRWPRLEDALYLYGGSVLRSAIANEGSGKTYLDAPHMAIRGDPTGVVLEVRALASSKDFRDGMEICLSALEETQATKILMDLRKMRLVLVDDERWLAQDLLPRLGRTALKWMGIVTPENALARVIVADLAKPRPTGTQSKHCVTVEEAQAWLSHAQEPGLAP